MAERLEWLTDVSTSLDGTEHRVPLRAFPRYQFSGQYVLSDVLAGTSYAEHAKRSEVLEMLRTADKVRLPIGPGLVHRGAGTATPQLDILTNAATGPLLQDLAIYNTTSGGVVVAQPGSYAAPWTWAAPLLEVELGDAREVEHKTDRHHAFQLSVLATGFDEYFSPALDLAAEPAPAGWLRHNWISSLRESLAATSERFDNGHLPLALQRYLKRSVSLDILLLSRADIVAFRRFIFVCQGRYRSFMWHCPTDAASARWRLGADAVEIEYVSTRVAQVRLMLTRTEQ